MERREGLRKEFYRLASHLLSRQAIPSQSQRFQESLADSDRGVIKGLMDRIRSPQIDKEQVKKTLADIETEIRQMQSEAVCKGIAVLATIARVEIPLL